MSKIPKGWLALPLAEAIQPRGEKVMPSDHPTARFIGMDNIESQTTQIIGSVPASELKSSAARFYAGDVLYGRLRPYLNKVAKPNFDGLASAEFIVFPDTQLLTSTYLKLRLNACDFVSFASHLNEGDRPRVGFDQIGASELLLPPADEQKRITTKIEELFSELDNGLESLKLAQAQLKTYRQAILKHAFEGKLTADWRTQQCAEVSEWQRVQLDVLGTVVCGQSPSVPEANYERKGILYVTGPEQWNGSHIEEVKWTEHPKKIAPEGSIFITVKGAGVGKLFPGTRCAIGRDVYAFCPNDLASTEFIIYALRYSIDQVVLQAKGDIPGLSKSHILDHTIGLPSKEEQDVLVKRLDQVFSSIAQLESEIKLQLQKSEALRQSILKKAFSGQLVAQDPNDEPASALLERIRSTKEVRPRQAKRQVRTRMARKAKQSKTAKQPAKKKAA